MSGDHPEAATTGLSLHCYGWSTDTPGHLRSLVDGDAAAREAALRHIGGAVVHQESFSHSAPAVFAVLIDQVREPRGGAAADAGCRADAIHGLAGILVDLRYNEAELADQGSSIDEAATEDDDVLDGLVAEARDSGQDAQNLYDEGYGDDFHYQALRRCRDLAPAAVAALTVRVGDPDPGVRALAAEILAADAAAASG